MQSPSHFLLKPLALASILSLTACGGGGGSSSTPDDTSTAITVSGTATAPSGVVASLEPSPSILMALSDFIFPAVQAGISGLDPVTGALVELVRIDDDGNQIGEVLASTTTSITGEYSLALPGGVSLAGNLILRITGSGTTMSALVVEQEVDINPISQYVLDKFVDDEDLVLADLDVNDIVTLTGKVEEFDLTADPTADLAEMLALLEAEVGELVDNEIAVIESEPADSTQLASAEGRWVIVGGGLEQHDSEDNSWGTTATSLELTDVNLTVGDEAGEIDISGGNIYLDTVAMMGISAGEQILTIETEADLSDEFAFSGQVDSDGNLVIQEPFSEEIDEALPDDLDGPDYGWRYPPVTSIAYDTGNNNLKVMFGKSAAVRYDTVDTNNDGIKDAVDPNSKSGDEVFIDYSFILKQAESPITQASGSYGYITFDQEMDEFGSSSYSSTVGRLNFSNSDATVDLNNSSSVVVDRVRSIETGSVTGLTLDVVQEEDSTGIPYQVDSTSGLISVAGYEGAINADQTIMALVSADDIIDPGSQLVGSFNSFLIATKLPEATPVLDNASYKLYSASAGMAADGRLVIKNLSSSSTLSFNADGTLASVSVEDSGIERANDIAHIENIIDLSATLTDLSVSYGENAGRVSISLGNLSENQNTGDSSSMEGFVSADGQYIIYALKVDTSTAAGSEYEVGFGIAVKQ